MREFKFRSWHKEKKIMAQVGQLYWDGQVHVSYKSGPEKTGYFFGGNNVGDDWRKEEHELMQFTGLIDHKENHIYEHDIVSVGYGYGKVIYHAGSFMIEWIDDKEANMELLAETCLGKNIFRKREDLLIIGNIYENPELLTP